MPGIKTRHRTYSKRKKTVKARHNKSRKTKQRGG
jgi:hypothetical protein